MAIVKMNKFTLLTFKSKRASILEKLQDFGDIQFINLQNDEFLAEDEVLKDLSKDNSDTDYAECEEKLSMAKTALQFLEKYLPQKSGLKTIYEGKKNLSLTELESLVNESKWIKICNRLKEKENNIERIAKEQAKMQSEIDSLKPFEMFDVPLRELNSIKTPYFLGSVSKQYKNELISETNNCYIEILSEDDKDVYFLALCVSEQEENVSERLRGFGFSPFKTDLEDKPIDIIHKNMYSIEKLDTEIFFIQESLLSIEEDDITLELVCEYYENILIRKEAISNFLKTENVILIQGWVPEEAKEKLNDLMKSVLEDDYYIKFEDVKDDEIERVPVKLKNNQINSAFESITEMYSTPRYDEIDPTPFQAPFYLLFFGMMVADMGYGLVQLIVTYAALKLCNLDEGKKRLAKFFFYLSFPVIGFGAIYGSFFGFELKIPGHINPTTNIKTVLIASVVFGVIQIFSGLGIKAYMLIKIGKPKDAFYDVGAWVMALVGIALVLGADSIGLPHFIKTLSLLVMIAGMAVIVLTAGRAEKTRGAQLGQGAYALYGITSYVSDLVSYTRLMALGLAGGSLAAAMNLIMNMMPGFSIFIFGPVIFIFGHIFNIGLSMLGAYVHTCRLQYVEYFGKFYEGGGKAFTPFKTQNKYVNIKKQEI